MQNSDRAGPGARNGLLLSVSLTAAAVCALLLASCASFQAPGRNAAGYEDSGRVSLHPRRQAGRETCALACLMTVFEYWGRHVSSEEVRRELGEAPEGGYTLGQLRDFARKHGFQAYIVHGDLAFLREHTGLGRPVIAVLYQNNVNHSVVVVAIERDGTIIAMDPAVGRMVQMSQADFLGRWEKLDNAALLLAPGPASGSL